MSFTFYKFARIEQTVSGVYREEKIFLQASIVDHPIWKDLEFWESAMFNSINEELSQQKNYKLEENETAGETTLRLRNLVFGQLTSYSHNMLMFNLDKMEVRNLLSKFCKAYSLTEMQVRDIMVNLSLS